MSGPNGHLDVVSSQMDATMQRVFAEAIRNDGWKNIATSIGVQEKDARLKSQFNFRDARARGEIEALYEQSGLFPLIVDRVPEHATRRWINVTGAQDNEGKPDKDFGRTLIEALEEVDAQGACFELMRLDRLYGGAAIINGADDGQTPDKPLDLKRVRKVHHLNVLSRWEIWPGEINRDVTSPNFRQPEYYTFTGASILSEVMRAPLGSRIHHSRVIRLRRHRIASELSMHGIEGWDLPIIERVYDAVRQYGMLLDYIEAMFQDLVQGVFKMKGLADAFSADQGDEVVLKRLQTIAFARSLLNMIALDEDETYERRGQVPTGLSELVIRVMDYLAAVAEMPLSILFGQPPTGLSTDDESGRTAFYDSIANKQNRLLRPVINRIADAVIAAKEGPLKGKAPAQWSFEFRPLKEPTEAEDAERRGKEAETEERLILNNILTATEVRSKYVNDPRSPYQIDSSTDDAEDELGGGKIDPDNPELAKMLRGADPSAAPTGAVGAGAEDVQKTALNGAQVTSASEIVAQVARKELPRDSGVAQLMVFFNITAQDADRVMGSVGKTFFIETPEAPTPPIGAAPAPSTPPQSQARKPDDDDELDDEDERADAAATEEGKTRAHAAVEAALESGELKKGKCEVCGESDAQAHHDDYRKTLDVRWLCAKHHKAAHKE